MTAQHDPLVCRPWLAELPPLPLLVATPPQLLLLLLHLLLPPLLLLPPPLLLLLPLSPLLLLLLLLLLSPVLLLLPLSPLKLPATSPVGCVKPLERRFRARSGTAIARSDATTFALQYKCGCSQEEGGL